MEYQQGCMRPPPPPEQQSWYSGQFQYLSHSPSPNQQWAPPPPSHPPPPYPAQHHYYPPPRLNQEWHNTGWNQNQGVQYPVHNNGEDWAAKAREWAAAQSSSNNQFPEAQYIPVGSLEENQYSMAKPQNSDGQHFPVPASSCQQNQPSTAPPYQSSEASFSSGYVLDGHMPFNGRNGSLVGESTAAFLYQESSPSNSSVHQQEVPSSYSSVAGKEEFAEQNKQSNQSPWSFNSNAQQQAQPTAVHRTISMGQTHYAFSHQSDDRASDPSDQPLDFAPGFIRDRDLVQSACSQNSGVYVGGTDSPAMGSIHSLKATAAPGVAYPPLHAPGPQLDPSLAISSPVPGHSGPLFGRITGQNLQPVGPSVSVPFSGSAAFPGNRFGASGVSDRPKKPSVPNWLREELIKNKAVIPTSAPEFSVDAKSVQEEVINKSFLKGNSESKTIDSSRSAEDDDDDDDEEDDAEIARTSAINHEIKRVLTEVLLKVTDELFDEIATKVLSEEGSSIPRKVNYNASTSAPEVPISKASTKVLITAKPSENDLDDTRKSTSSVPGDLLGLGSYASEDDEDDDVENIHVPNSRRDTIHRPSAIKIRSDNVSGDGNDLSVANTKDTQENNSVFKSHSGRVYPNGNSDNFKPDDEPSNHGSGKESMHVSVGSKNSSKTNISADSHDLKNGAEVVYKTDISMLKDNIEKAERKTEPLVESVGAKGTSDDTKVEEAKNKPVKNDKYGRKGRSFGKDIVKEIRDDRGYVGGYDSDRRQEERKVKKERIDDRDGFKDKLKVHDRKYAEKSVDTDSKRRSSHRDKKETKETEKDRRTKEGYERMKDGTKDEKGERSRDKNSSRHKRRRSSSVGSRDRDRKNHAMDSHTKDSSDDESKPDSRRKSHSRKQKSSPSPVRSRRRQVSRSPHSKHSQHRHSPYSSLETARRKRSRSRSPARRKR